MKMNIMAENENIFCIECKTSLEQCFCICPYCGEQKNNCFCSIIDARDDVEILSTKHHSKLRESKSSFKSTRDDDWWRLEKWQIGRRNFP